MTEVTAPIDKVYAKLAKYYEESKIATLMGKLSFNDQTNFVQFIEAHSPQRLEGLKEYCIETLSLMAIPSKATVHSIALGKQNVSGWVVECPIEIYQDGSDYIPKLSFEIDILTIADILGGEYEETIPAIEASMGHIPYTLPLSIGGGSTVFIQCIDFVCLRKLIKDVTGDSQPLDNFEEKISAAERQLSAKFGTQFDWDLNS